MKKYLVLLCLFSTFELWANKTDITILIDPGHGGSDPGHLPSSDSLKQEKQLVLEISMKIGNYLSYNLSNVNVLYTRTGDKYPTLDERVNQANSNNVDYMLSIHINGSTNLAAEGCETHIHNYDAKTAHIWAKSVQNQLKQSNIKNRGVKTMKDLGHSLQILKYTKMPTILVECGFITHESESKFLNTINGQEIIASAIFKGTKEFLEKMHPEINFNLPLLATESPKENKSMYKVQIMASIDSVGTNIPEFTKLNMPVERVLTEGESIYKYKYFVGPFEDKKSAKMAQKEVRDKGFEDAFLVFMK